MAALEMDYPGPATQLYNVGLLVGMATGEHVYADSHIP